MLIILNSKHRKKYCWPWYKKIQIKMKKLLRLQYKPFQKPRSIEKWKELYGKSKLKFLEKCMICQLLYQIVLKFFKTIVMLWFYKLFLGKTLGAITFAPPKINKLYCCLRVHQLLLIAGAVLTFLDSHVLI